MASPRPDPLARVDRVLAPLTALAAAFAVVVLLIGPELIGAKQAGGATQARSGKQIFTAEGCGGCHTLADAGASGTSGPTSTRWRRTRRRSRPQSPAAAGSMPSFDLPAPELKALAEYVASVAGR